LRDGERDLEGNMDTAAKVQLSVLLIQTCQNIKKREKHAYILEPGYGARGYGRDVAHSLVGVGLGAIVNASRSIMWAYLSTMEKPV
jgi:hypothetical protein